MRSGIEDPHLDASVPLWLKLVYGAAVPIIAVVYWRKYGPSNFLWLPDIGLACTTASVLTGDRLLASMVAVGVIPLELAWTLDFLAKGRVIGLAAYMYDPQLPLFLRSLSLFHLAMPPTLIFLLYQLGYEARHRHPDPREKPQSRRLFISASKWRRSPYSFFYRRTCF